MSLRYGLAWPALGLWLGCWITLGGARLEWTAPAIIAFAVAVGFVWRPHAAVIGLVAVSALLGIALSTLRLLPLHDPVLQSWVEHRLPITARVTVAADPVRSTGRTRGSYRRPDGWRMQARLEQLSTTHGRSLVARVPVEVRGTGRTPLLSPGALVTVEGSLGYASMSHGLAATVEARSWQQIRSPPRWQEAIASVRHGLLVACRTLPPDERGLLPGLTLGDTRAVPADLVAAMKSTGLTHLTAVSGGNLAVVLGLVLLLTRRLRLSRGWQAGVACLVLLVFVVLVQAEPSVLRAAVMAGIALLAFVTQRPRAALSTLSAAVVVLLLIDPWLSRSWGFALSAAATAGLLVLAGPLTRLFSARMPRPLAASIAVALAAQVATAPLVAALAGGVPLASVPANVLAVPLAGPATVCGLLAAVLHQVWPPLATPFVLLGGGAAWWIATVARWCAGLGLPIIGMGSGFTSAVALSVVLLACGLAWLTRHRWLQYVPSWVRGRGRQLVAAGLVVVMAMWFGLPPLLRWLSGWPPSDVALVMCDVGQGDAIVLPTTPGHAVLVDAGPDPAPVNRCLGDLGIDVLDFIVLTHFHADHVEGLAGAIQHRRVGYVVVTGLADPPDEQQRVAASLAAAKIPMRTVVMGWHGVVGSVSWQVLWPQRYIKGEGSDPNNASIALLVRSRGVRILLTGDVEPAAQRAIEQDWGAPQVDVLKVPHHGSANQDPGFLAWSGARLALISVGVGNQYGHPAPATLLALAHAHVQAARTDQSGDIAVVVRPDGPALVRRRRSGMARSRT